MNIYELTKFYLKFFKSGSYLTNVAAEVNNRFEANCHPIRLYMFHIYVA